MIGWLVGAVVEGKPQHLFRMLHCPPALPTFLPLYQPFLRSTNRSIGGSRKVFELLSRVGLLFVGDGLHGGAQFGEGED